MEEYDVIILGGSTTGAFFARRLAEQGLRVLILEKETRESVGTVYDIFHLSRADLVRHGLPVPQPGDADYAFSFEESCNYSAFGHWPKPGAPNPVIGLHKHLYILRLLEWAEEAGAEVRFGTPFADFLREDGRIAGAVFRGGEARAKLVADCSGIPAAGRTRLAEGDGVENFSLTPEDLFYVILWYVRYPQDHARVCACRSWPYWKSWEAPQADPAGAIIGTGSSFGFDWCERMHAEFEKKVSLPPYEVQRTERGRTPYRRPPYSFVTDGFIAMGDAACLTKPSAGEGCASSMVQAEIAAAVVCPLLRQGRPLTRAALWPVNLRYQTGQGREFASLLATLVSATASSAEENEFLFRKDVVFSKKLFANMDAGLKMSAGETLRMALILLGGLLTGRMRPKTIRRLLKASRDAGAADRLYGDYPPSPDGFENWCRRADELWKAVGTMADNKEESV